MELTEDFEIEESAQERGMKWFGRVLAIIIILAVSGLGDMMYIQLMSAKFPVGFGLVICYAGAFTGFLCVIYMLIGKSSLFTPGPQMVVAWLVFAIELILTALNLILVFAGTSQGGLLDVWSQMAPATPVVNMAGVAVLFFLDESQKMKHEDVEMAMENKRATRRYYKQMAKARLRLQHKQLSFLVTELDAAAASPESLLGIRQTAQELNAHLLGQLSGGRTYRPQSQPMPLSAPAAPVGLPAPADNRYTPAPDARIVPEAAPARQPEPARATTAPASKGFFGGLKDKVVGVLSGGEQETVTLAQTGEIAAPPKQATPEPAAPVPSEKTSNQLYREERRASARADVDRARIARATRGSQVVDSRRARRASRFNRPAKPQFATPSPVEHAPAPAAPVVEDDGTKNAPAAPAKARKRAASTATKKSGGSTTRTKKQA